MTFKKVCKNPGAVKKKKVGPEALVQIALVRWIKLQYPEVGKHIIKIDNEGRRSFIGHELAIKQGLHIGASDIFISWPANGYHGAWIELKREKWKLVPSELEHVTRQKNFLEKMKVAGYFTAFCVGIDEALAAVSFYLKGF